MQQRTPAKPVPLKKGGLTTEPSPVLQTRNVKRHIATCIAVLDTENVSCDFPNRKSPKLHSAAGGAEVESARHLRSAHKDLLSLEISAKRTRRVVDEQIEIEPS